MNVRAHAIAAVAACLFLAGPLAAAASADCGGAGRPACSILRPPPAPPAPPPPALAPECVLFVGGIGSHVYDPGYRSFDDIAAALPAGVRVHAFRYDSYGPIADAAARLRDEARSLAADCATVHVVAHSMGGVVADRAFSLGLTGSDRVGTYVALASPHNGAWAAIQLCGIGEIDERASELFRRLAQLLRAPDITAASVCDMARTKPPRPPRLVHELRLRLADDEIVLHSDWADRRYDARELLPHLGELDGHGAILRDDRALAAIAASVTSGRPPSDDRGDLERAAGTLVGTAADGVLQAGHRELAHGLFAAAYVSRAATLTQQAFDALREIAEGLIARFPIGKRVPGRVIVP